MSFCSTGILTTVLPSRTPPDTAVSVSSSGVTPCTSTDSATLPTSSLTSMRGWSLVRSSMPSRTYLLEARRFDL